MSTMATHDHTEQATPAETLQLQYAAMRVQFTWWGTRKALTEDQQAEVANDFNADKSYLSASKKLIDTKHPAYKPVTKIKREIAAHWKECTLPYPEPSIRLLPQAKLEEFEAYMARMKNELRVAVLDLQSDYYDLRSKARDDLGRLFNGSDYPTDITNLFAVQWNVENVSPPDWLMEIKPEWYEREMMRVRGLFNNAVELAEQAFVKELTELVENLTDRLTDNADGTPKVFGDGCVDKLKSFIGRFRELSVRSNDDLEKLVEQCDTLTKGVSADAFRNIPELRQFVAGKLAAVKTSMEETMTVAPRRKITRRTTQE